ncbi:hypothetical protein [Aureibacter tunicatorum]|uniref:Uncharacterized protein n=1 Tax=Aureibacter tunicatorum TaxID=866807 RepID=A0AAE4BTW6_9BACT|nr:hypothetical protein [Aureibacter tunicatorum]MDR6240087.1 hypothetical protein [Aureibacter tunicatorum]BDD04558.1 hypothetical protein AUTU_20410 [Aureibacter tunicatorum]
MGLELVKKTGIFTSKKDFSKLVIKDNTLEISNQKGKTLRYSVDDLAYMALIKRDYKPIHTIHLLILKKKRIFSRGYNEILILKRSEWNDLEKLLKYLVKEDKKFYDWRRPAGCFILFRIFFDIFTPNFAEVLEIGDDIKEDSDEDHRLFTRKKIAELKVSLEKEAG